MAQGLIGIQITQYGLKGALRKLDPKRISGVRDRALNKGSRHLLKVIRGQSRVKSGHYKGSWSIMHLPESRAIVNSADYAEFVTGNTMRTTLRGGRRRGAAEAFMRRIYRENTMPVRRIMQEAVREIAAGR